MEVIICDSPDDVARLVATHIGEIVRRKPTAVLGLATGRSPGRTYTQLTLLARQQGISFADVRVFMLDEYLSISDDHPSRFYNVLRMFADEIGIPASNIRALPNLVPEGDEPDVVLRRQCEDFEDTIAEAGGIDLQLLGISQHGHIGFNEPMSSLTSRTRVKTLTEHTRRANADFFAEVDVVGEEVTLGDGFPDVPTHVVTQGIGTILEARHALLLVTGEEKAAIVAQAVEGPVTAYVPGSALQLHAHATVVVDEAAAKDLTMADYYRQVQHNKQYIQPPIT